MRNFYNSKSEFDVLMDMYTKKDSFQVASGELIVSDPCYGKNSWCQQRVQNAKQGEWVAQVDYCGNRIAHLYVYHSGYAYSNFHDFEEIGTCGVDSGQLGVFDEAFYKSEEQFGSEYPDVPANDYGCEDDRKFYGFCCDATLSKEQCGLLPHGCVTSSGYGDGCYVGVCYRAGDGEAVGIEMEFIPTEDEDEDEY